MLILLLVFLFIVYVRCFKEDDWLQRAPQYHPASSHSYLDWPRIHFAGHFRSDSPTANNLCELYDIKNFEQIVRKNSSKVSWNVNGSGHILLDGCEITSVCYTNGECVTENDELIGQPVISNYNRPNAKFSCLDPGYELSTIYGMYFKIPHVFTAKLLEVTYADEIMKVPERKFTEGAGAIIHSMLTDLKWDESNRKYRIVEEMKNIASQYPPPNVLSVKMNVDYFEKGNIEFGNFTQGRITGTIGIAGPAEPFHYLRHRELYTHDEPILRASFRVFPKRRKILLDLGNSLIHTLGAPDVSINKRLQVAYPLVINSTSYNCMSNIAVLGYIPYERDQWYKLSAGIVQIPTYGELSIDQIKDVQERPLLIRRIDPETDECINSGLQEAFHGTMIGIMGETLYRTNPEDTWQVIVFASKFGEPLENLKVTIKPGLVQYATNCSGTSYPFNEPETAIEYTHTNITDATGIAIFQFNSSNPGSPRPIDGQLYFYNIGNNGITNDIRVPILLYTSYKVSEGGPTWYQDIYPIFKMYANMLPSMANIINLASYEDVMKKREMLKTTMSLPITDPSYMPATRDLSRSKQEAILKWLDNPKRGAHPQATLEELHGYLQTALEIELSTIPPYLSALFSIRKGHNNDVINIIRSVVLEEMLHMTLVANILSSTCGSPTLNDSAVIPSYPTTMPGNVHPELTISLQQFSLGLVEDVFLKIEEPDDSFPLTFRQTVSYTNDPTEDAEYPHPNYNTIGRFYYQNVWKSLKHLDSTHDNLFACADVNKQVTEKNWYSHVVDKPFAVMNLNDARRAIQLITEQGEGSSPTQPYDSQRELSHYYRLLEIVMGYKLVLHERTMERFDKKDMGDTCHHSYSESYMKRSTCRDDDCRGTKAFMKCDVPFYFTGERVPFYEDEVWPIISNPSSEMYNKDSRVRYVSDRFNQEYSNLLRCLHETFNGNRDSIIGCMSMMSYMLELGRQLVKMPIDLNGPQHAAPTFEYIDII
ncbi:uncharacterized protein LOC144344969 [Saccoglossus kowalevskii]